MIKQFFAKEKAYFNNLHKNAQTLLTTIFLSNLIDPLFGIFLNAFFWRQSHNIILVALYNLIMYAVIPLGFYLNGLILRKKTPATAYTLSLVVSGLFLAPLLFLPAITLSIIITFGIIQGITTGIYWANRNLLTLKTTTTHDRISFSSIESASTTITSVFIPFVIGWFITLGTPMHLYTPLQGYQILGAYMLLVILRIGIFARGIKTQEVKPSLLVKNISDNWKKFRLIQFLYGLENAVDFFVPVLFVLILVGNEAILGTVQSVAAISSSLLIYYLGKTLKTGHRLRLIGLSVAILITGALTFSILYSAIGVFIFLALQALSHQFMWVGGSSINYDLIDVDNKDATQHYAYVCDEEIYLNGGRAIGILLFMLLIYLTTESFALRYAPLVFTVTQLFLLFAYRTIERKK